MPEVLVVGFVSVAVATTLAFAFGLARLHAFRRSGKTRSLLYSKRLRAFQVAAERLLNILEQQPGIDTEAEQRLLRTMRRQIDFLASRGVRVHQREVFWKELDGLTFSFSRLQVIGTVDPRQSRLRSLRSTLGRSSGYALRDPTGLVEGTDKTIAPEFHQLTTEDSIPFTSVLFGAWATAALYFSIFVPLLWHTAREVHLNPVDTLLFTQVPPVVQNLRGWTLLPLLNTRESLPFWYAYAATYGAIALVLALLLRVAHRHSLAVLAVVANGLVWGYYATIYFSSTILHLIDTPQRATVWVKLIYVILFFYVIDAIKDVIPYKGVDQKNYSTLLDGTYGIVCSLLLVKGFGERPAAYLTGPLFLVICFITTYLARQTIGRQVYFVTQLDRIDVDTLGLAPVASARLLFGLWWRTVRSYHDQELAFTMPKLNIRSAWYSHRRALLSHAAVVFALFSLFPLAAFGIAASVCKLATALR